VDPSPPPSPRDAAADAATAIARGARLLNASADSPTAEWSGLRRLGAAAVVVLLLLPLKLRLLLLLPLKLRLRLPRTSRTRAPRGAPRGTAVSAVVRDVLRMRVDWESWRTSEEEEDEEERAGAGAGAADGPPTGPVWRPVSVVEADLFSPVMLLRAPWKRTTTGAGSGAAGPGAAGKPLSPDRPVLTPESGRK
jgi:hypothetical protein